jgi:hypothetical protein
MKRRSRAAKGDGDRRNATKSRVGAKHAVKGTVRSAAASKQRARESERFVRDLQVRGEAARLNADGKLPLHATHVIKRAKKGQAIEVRRARFKAF